MGQVLLIIIVTLSSVLSQEATSGAVLELTGDEPTVRFGGDLTLVHDASNNKLSCSGALEAADLRIAGSSVSVAQMMTRLASLESLQSQMVTRLSSLEARVATLEASPPSLPPSSPPQSSPCDRQEWNQCGMSNEVYWGCCASDALTCYKQSNYYSQCRPNGDCGGVFDCLTGIRGG